MKRKSQSTIKSGFYKKYINDTQEVKPKQEPKEKVIVINQSDKENLLTTIFKGIGSVFRVIVYILLFFLSSIGLTALINEETRDILFKIIRIKY